MEKHKFESSLDNIASQNSWCPFCANNILCSKKKCETCLYKSLENHPKAQYWASSNNMKARDVFKGSSNLYDFVCEKGLK